MQATTPLTESIHDRDLLPRIPAPRVPVITHTEGVPPLPAVRPVASPHTLGHFCFRCQGVGKMPLTPVPCSCCLGKGRTPL